MRKIIVVALLPLLFFLAGCTVGPKYVRPAVQSPGTFYNRATGDGELRRGHVLVGFVQRPRSTESCP